MDWLRSIMLPAEGSSYAGQVDNLYLFIFGINVFFFLLIAALLGYFVWRYRRRGSHDVTPRITHNFKLEVVWSVIPLILVIVIFFWGFDSYMEARVAPHEALEIQAVGKKWLWQFEYPDGMRTINEIHVPVGKPVRMIMSSEDVIHSFYVPSFRVKMDVLPNRYTELWFHPTETGVHTLFCAEYCGRGHSDMIGKIHVDTEEKFREWQELGDEQTRTMPLPELGAILYESRGCNTCHSLDGSRRDGPSFQGTFGSTRQFSDGTSVIADENYIRESILEPQAKILSSYEGIMPTFQGLLRDARAARPDRVHQGATVDMADVLTAPAGVSQDQAPEVNYLNERRGFLSWAFTLDHKRIGVMYLWSVLIAFFLGGVFAMLLRLELLTPEETIMGADAYNQSFTLHGAIMIFLFIIPAIPAALGNFVLPLLIGAKDVAFPRLNLASYWIYVLGALFALTAMVTGGVDTGWTFYTPYSTSTGGAVSTMTLAAFILGFSSIFTGINFIATIHKLRAPGMTWFNMPLFNWGVYATAIIQVLATPVLGITLLLLMMERLWEVGIFDPRLGGDPVLFQHFFWFYSHPAVYIMILPGMGNHQRSDPDLFEEAHLRLQGHVPILRSPSLSWASWFGVITCSPRDSRDLATAIFSFSHVPGGHSFGREGLQLAGDDVQRFDRSESADAATRSSHSLLLFANRRAHWSVPGQHLGHRRPPARHVLRRGALPLRDDGRHRHRFPRRVALLVAEDVRPHVFGSLGAYRRIAGFCRLQRDLHPAVHHGQPRDAAPLL